MEAGPLKNLQRKCQWRRPPSPFVFSVLPSEVPQISDGLGDCAQPCDENVAICPTFDAVRADDFDDGPCLLPPYGPTAYIDPCLGGAFISSLLLL